MAKGLHRGALLPRLRAAPARGGGARRRALFGRIHVGDDGRRTGRGCAKESLPVTGETTQRRDTIARACGEDTADAVSYFQNNIVSGISTFEDTLIFQKLRRFP
jgi:hypothetical protein